METRNRSLATAAEAFETIRGRCDRRRETSNTFSQRLHQRHPFPVIRPITRLRRANTARRFAMGMDRLMQKAQRDTSRPDDVRESGRVSAEAPSEPVDRAEEVPLSDWNAAMPQNVVRRRYKEEEIRQGELL